jgi:topoisomerase-4 subunit B
MMDDGDLFGGALNGATPAPAAEPDRKATPKPRAEKQAPVPALKSAESYTAASIEVLEGLEPVRRRPGMYIGGTDEAALHHLFAEVIDNSMDEAVAKYATWIDVSIEPDDWISITDNGRGIPIDPHPKFPDKSALEVIMTTLHAGGKFDSGAYQTSGGLHGVGVSVVNALSTRLEVEVARGQMLYTQAFERGHAVTTLQTIGKVQNRRGTKVRFKPDPQIFANELHFKPARLFKMARSKAYLFSGVEIRWHSHPSLLEENGPIPTEAVFHYPGGLKDYLASETENVDLVAETMFTGKVEKSAGHGSVEWAVSWLAGDDGYVRSYCNTIPTSDGGTHEAGLRLALQRGLKDHAERIGQAKRFSSVTTDDVMVTCAAMISVFIREPEFQGQNKGRLMTLEATRIVETIVRDAFDHWLAASPSQALKLIDWSV